MIKLKIKIPNLSTEIDKASTTRILNKAVKALKEATPVDTGKARNGWKVAEDKKSIYNDVDYIDELNRGTSTQAPPYFIEKTLLSQDGILPSGTIVRSKN